MDLKEELRAARQLVEVLSVAGGYHLIKLVGNLIDGEEGVIEQRISQLLARRILARLDLPVRARGLEQVQGLTRYCVVSNHGSHLDWAVLPACFPTPLRFIAKKELAGVPVVGDYLRKRGVLIDRRRGLDARRAIRVAVGDGKPWPIVIFPEGTRSPDGDIHPFRRGGLRILAEAGLTLVPVCILGTFAALPRGARRVRGGQRLELIVGEPVTASDGRSAEGRMDLVEQRIRQLWLEAQELAAPPGSVAARGE